MVAVRSRHLLAKHGRPGDRKHQKSWPAHSCTSRPSARTCGVCRCGSRARDASRSRRTSLPSAKNACHGARRAARPASWSSLVPDPERVWDCMPSAYRLGRLLKFHPPIPMRSPSDRRPTRGGVRPGAARRATPPVPRRAQVRHGSIGRPSVFSRSSLPRVPSLALVIRTYTAVAIANDAPPATIAIRGPAAWVSQPMARLPMG